MATASACSTHNGELIFFVNGAQVVESKPDPLMPLVEFLRTKLHLTGTKVGCGEGGCGACTVMISRYNMNTDTVVHYSINSCLAPLAAMHGLAVTTVEGVGSTKTKVHPVQERIVKAHGTQCGFCTPGIVMSMYTLLRNEPLPSLEQLSTTFDGNLCRCTGYRPILDGYKTFTKEYCEMGGKCRKIKRRKPSYRPSICNQSIGDIEDLVPYDPADEPKFPLDLKVNHEKYHKTSLTFRTDHVTWFRPTTLDELLDLKSTFPQARLVNGNTEIAIEMRFKKMKYDVMIATTHIPDLKTLERNKSGITIGASITLSRLDTFLKQECGQMAEEETRVYSAVVDMLQWFGGKQVRNVAVVAGNIMTASPISDLNPIFLASGSVLDVVSRERGRRKIRMDNTFFKGYRRTEVKPDEILLSVTLPATHKNEYFSAFKQANRRDDDIAVANAAMKVVFHDDTNIIKDMALAFGGMAPVTVMATNTTEKLRGSTWDSDLVSTACSLLADDLPLTPDAPGGMVQFRKTLTLSFFFKFYLRVKSKLTITLGVEDNTAPTDESATQQFVANRKWKSSQVYEEVEVGQPITDAVGRPLVHKTAYQQATGEACFVDDITPVEGELFLSLVLSSKTHANIINMDASEALSIAGVVDFISVKDVPGQNVLHGIDEHIFATDKVTCQGQVVGAIVATSHTLAKKAAQIVRIDYEELESVVTIKDSIAKESFYKFSPVLQHGDVEEGFRQSDHVICGEVSTGAQEHFYMETQTALAVPREEGEMELFVSSQNPTEVQGVVAEALNIQANKITVRVKRLGGGFGGKETRPKLIACPTAIAAAKLMKRVRCTLEREEDMVSMGTRHPFLGKYKIGFTNQGKVMSLELDLYSNCGNSLDVSPGVMERALWHADNSYRVPNFVIRGYLCKTNRTSCTAFRGFGAPQAMFVAETWITDIAYFLNIVPEQVRQTNLYKNGDPMPFGMQCDKGNIQHCWEECLDTADLDTRRQQVKQFNRENRWKKKGISVTPVTYGIAFGLWELNQSGALVHIYRDGSVLIAHGGTEMGQGLHTKMIQVASRALKLPTTKIHISETNTTTVPNTSPSAASSCSDLNGMAIVEACEKLLSRLDPVIQANPDKTWEEWIRAAYEARISLSATGFYKVDNLHFDWKTSTGNPFSYLCFGAACTEVQIDCLTGDHEILQTDIVMDVGRSLNPALDIGQIEGAFMQGYGMMVLEHYKVSPDGTLLTRGPGTYKLPSFGNIPTRFNVSLLKGSSNKRAVYSSKAIGEPPLFLASSAFFAIVDAIKSAREDAGCSAPLRLNSPATAADIRMACTDRFTQQFPLPPEGSFKPWFTVL
ncbi:xanthine dehydrogenase/oxidase-like [Gigantopelta aegis]|uniref:xanthine dehydrogenase/oxidase-like n=1 Tax=Gigantopelta aegis TaxID=1735272 RepID=UPI001B88AA95|nr:xanthine dehydrogenase/oxidase-like [Gigantopelta aegis]